MKTQKLEEIEARKFIRRYACSTCWGELVAEPVEGERYMSLVHCGKPDCSGAGFVTKHYIEHRRTEDHFDHMEAKRNLRAALHLPDPLMDKSTDELLKELGF